MHNITREIKNTWNKDAINALLMTKDQAVYRALIVLHDRQTVGEQSMQATTEANGRGFSGTDATFLSSLAERVKKGWGLSPKQLACIRRTNAKGYCSLAKYWGQLQQEIAARPTRISA